MRHRASPAFSLFELLVILALLGLLFALLLPAVVKARSAASRARSANNLKQLGLALHNHHDATGAFPPGNDDNHFSAAARLLPYLEQDALYRLIDFKKPADDEANKKVAATLIPTFLSPNDPLPKVTDATGATNYLFCAGSNYALENNNGLLFQNSKVKLQFVTDGTSNTVVTGETLKGDGGAKAEDVRRQHIALKKDDLKELTDESGVKDFAENRNVTGNRCAAWIDGRFLQGTFTGTRIVNDKKPDVTCAGAGGLSGLRSLGPNANVGMADGSVRGVNEKVDLRAWKAVTSRDGGEMVPDF
jgi:prepilin-type processing-associated H-X9-DG protein